MLQLQKFLAKRVLFTRESAFFCFFSFFSNFIAAAMEGASYGAILLAFSAITRQELPLPSFPLQFSSLSSLSPKTLLLISLGAAFVLQCIRCFFLYLSQHLFSCVTEKGLINILTDLNSQILRLSYWNFHKEKMGSLTELATSIPYFLPNYMALLSNLVTNLFLILVASFFLLNLSAKLLITILGVFLISGTIQRIFIKKLNAIYHEFNEESQKKTDFTLQILTGIRIIHLYGVQNLF